MAATGSADDNQRVLEQALSQLFAEADPNTTLTAVAEASGIGEAELRQRFPTFDDLLTTLVLDAYNAMGEAAETAAGKASANGATPIECWVAICVGVRSWALANKDKYALIWGRPIPGYDAPPETMAAGARTVLTLLGVLREAQAASQLTDLAEPPLSTGMAANVAPLGSGLLNGLPDEVIARMLVVWTQLHGMLSFEVYGHIAGVAADPGAFFEYGAAAMGRYVGIPN